jgi:hypothetical protein
MADSPRIEELKRRVQVDPASIAFAALAEEYRRAGRYEEAIAACQAGLQRHPAYLSAHVTLGRALLEIGRFDEAREELEHVLRAAPENLAAIRGLAEIHHRRGELPEALEQYKSALHVAKHDVEIERVVNEISRKVTGAEPAPEVPSPQPAQPAKPHLELVTWGRREADLPAIPGSEPEVVAEPEPEPLADAEPEPELQAAPEIQPEPEPEPDPALAALEGFLAAILRERDHLAADREIR